MPESLPTDKHALNSTPRPNGQSPWISGAAKLIFLLCCVFTIVLFIVPHDTAVRLTAENGPLENASAGLLGVGVILAALQFSRVRKLAWLAGFGVVLWMFFRELDYQRNFTAKSVESISFYRSSTIPLGTKLVVLVVLAPFVAAWGYVLWRCAKTFRGAFQRRERWTAYVLQAVLMVTIARSVEKLGFDHRAVVEEVFETGFALLVVNFLWGQIQSPKRDI